MEQAMMMIPPSTLSYSSDTYHWDFDKNGSTYTVHMTRSAVSSLSWSVWVALLSSRKHSVSLQEKSGLKSAGNLETL